MIGLVLAAGGQGLRFGARVPKQFAELDDRPIYLKALEPFLTTVAEAVIVVPEAWIKTIKTQIQGAFGFSQIRLRSGGRERQDSVERGLESLSARVTLVLVHDAARPFVSSDLIARVVEKARLTGAAVPALPVCETVKESDGEVIVRTLDRSCLQAVQTPQAFEVELLRRAFAAAREDNFLGTDEASLVERIGEPVHIVEGERQNIKITWQDDL